MAPIEEHKFLVILQLGSSEMDRLQRIIPRLKDDLQKLSTAPIEQAFHSAARDTFAYLVRSKFFPTQVIARIQTPGQTDPKDGRFVAPYLDNRDALFVIEIGAGFDSTTHFARAKTWLQRH